MEKRPNLDKSITVNDFKAFYWLKEELQEFCKKEGIKRAGSKIDIANRIEYYLKTGKVPENEPSQRKKQSKFDWNATKLTLDTTITDNYKNTENVRVFFREQIGKQFKFNVQFMNWMKSSTGKELRDAVTAWKQIEAAKKANKEPKDIAPQFEYNRYLRDFLADNPDRSRAVGIELWKVKKSRRGDNNYHKSDLKFLEEGTSKD